MSDVELKPCPFCGGEAHTKFWDEENGWSIGCHNLDCYAVIDEFHWYESKDAAIAAWNTRAPKAEAR